MFCSFLCSFSRNSIYSIHYTYYSLAISGLLTTLFTIAFLFITEILSSFFSFSFNNKYTLMSFVLLMNVSCFDYSSGMTVFILVMIFFIFLSFDDFIISF